MPSKQSDKSIDQSIVDVIRKNNPKTVKELVKLLQPKHHVPEQKILERILHLQNQRKIILKENQASSPPLLKNYIFSKRASWYWTVIAVTIATMALVFTIPKNAYPIIFARYVLGSIFVLFLPGFCLVKALFPQKELDNIERTALSLGISLAIVPLTSFFLNYTTWGITTTTVTVSLLALTITFASAALLREQEAEVKRKL